MFQSSNIKLRAIEPEDLELFYQWENDPEIWEVSNIYHPISRYTLKKYIENSHLDIFEAKQLRLMIEINTNKKTIGSVDLFEFDPYHSRIGIGILIADKTERQKGYAKESIHIIRDYCFNQLKIHTIFCNIAENNTTSINLFESSGFKKIGIKKDWIFTPEKRLNAYFYQLINR